MNEAFKKLTAEIKAQLQEALGKGEIKEFVEKTKAAQDTGNFEVIISTADIDRQGESIDQAGWDLRFYKMNPVVLWAHDYWALPIGLCTDINVQEGKLVAKGIFAPEDANPFAQQVRRLYDLKIVRATSVGFIPREQEGGHIKSAELLEFSFVPVPANPLALSLSKAKAQELRLDLAMIATKGLKLELQETEAKGVIPYADHGTAPEDAEWDAAKVQEELWGDGKNQKKYAQAHTWFDSNAGDDDGDGYPDEKGAYKLPHHNADLKANWKGVAAAMAALLGARGGVNIPEGDRKGVYNHLAKHYAEFEKEPPEFKEKMPMEGDPCTMDDGSEGEMHPNDASEMVCMPKPKKTTKPEPETSGDYIIIRVKDPEYFDPDSFRTIDISVEKGIKATIGCKKGEYEGGTCKIGTEVQRYLFDKAKWSEADAQAWVDEHSKSQKGGKTGRVLSEKNRKLIGDSVEQLKKAIAALEELLQATEPQGSEPEGGGKENPHGEIKVETAGLERVKADLEIYHATRNILRAVDVAVEKGLRKLKNFTPDKNR